MGGSEGGENRPNPTHRTFLNTPWDSHLLGGGVRHARSDLTIGGWPGSGDYWPHPHWANGTGSDWEAEVLDWNASDVSRVESSDVVEALDGDLKSFEDELAALSVETLPQTLIDAL